MSRSLEIYVTAKRSVAHRDLKSAIEEKRMLLAASEAAPPAFDALLEAARVGANKLITLGDMADQVEIGITLSETPLGGWDATVMVSIPNPTFPARSAAPRREAALNGAG